MEKKIEIGWLLDFYGNLLTKKQLSYMTMHYHDDYSLGEISEQQGVSRQAASDSIKKATKTLLSYEMALGLLGKQNKLEASLKHIDTLLERITITDTNLKEAREEIYRLIKTLED